mmetsp:Transcript_3449/g.9640  ORF Transcript_3449/g.9640 Transcript_3449/m.9640 type:complete len:109 (+) Transcript_3449:467-793(+)
MEQQVKKERKKIVGCQSKHDNEFHFISLQCYTPASRDPRRKYAITNNPSMMCLSGFHPSILMIFRHVAFIPSIFKSRFPVDLATNRDSTLSLFLFSFVATDWGGVDRL